MRIIERLSMLVVILSLAGVIYAIYQMSQIK
jgi:hypothetical protein